MVEYSDTAPKTEGKTNLKPFMMKKSAFIFCLTVVFASCKKDAFVEKENDSKPPTEIVGSSAAHELDKEFSLDTELIPFDQVKEIASQITNEEGTGIIEDEELIAKALAPLVENGRAIHKELIAYVSESEDWKELTEEEQQAILNMTDDQYVELSMIYSMTQGDNENARLNWNTVRSCLSGAFGLGDIYYLVVENPRALMTVNGAVKILKHVGLRYLGWIGLGLAIWDFVDCVS